MEPIPSSGIYIDDDICEGTWTMYDFIMENVSNLQEYWTAKYMLAVF